MTDHARKPRRRPSSGAQAQRSHRSDKDTVDVAFEQRRKDEKVADLQA